MLRSIQKAGFNEKIFDVGQQVNLNYVEGPNHGRSLVLIPAQIVNWENYYKVLPELSKKFRVYAVDIRGHGKSSWTTGDYSWKSVGLDMRIFLKKVVQQPSIVSGNSSGGIIALWLAANVPDAVSGIVLEDAPLFSAEMPRIKEKDKYAYKGLQNLVETLGDVQYRDFAAFLRGQELFLNNQMKHFPNWFVNMASFFIKRYQKSHPGELTLDIPYLVPFSLRLFIKNLSQFDPDFARAFVDGRFYEGIDHEEALKKVQCPMLLLHAIWSRHPEYGLVGAMDDDDAQRAQEIVPNLIYRQSKANHVIHSDRPKEFIRELEEFAEKEVI